MIRLRDYQLKALSKMKNGCILCGGVGSGKSITALSYYYLQNGGDISSITGETDYMPMDDIGIKNLYIITTAHKRNTLEWEKELAPFLLSTDSETNLYSNVVVIDSWNNIKKYQNIYGAFFIFDENHVTGYGAWVKSFLKIARKNEWIVLSATPGDSYSDYIPVFIANGFYKNKTDFSNRHIVYDGRVQFPKIDHYVNTEILNRYRRSILVPMDFERNTVSHHVDIYCDYDKNKYKTIWKNRWNPYTDAPIVNVAELYYITRRLVNCDQSRFDALLEVLKKHDRAIIFYNFDPELNELLGLDYRDKVIAQYNGHKHESIPSGDKWVYLVQYASCEGWNCTKTDTIIFFSQNYSYKITEQARGRIDRMNTPYKDLFYYHLKSRSQIDIRIAKCLKEKKDFNEMTDYRSYAK